MNGNKLESVQCAKDFGVSVASNLKCKHTAGKPKRMLGFINRNISLKTKDAILPLYASLVRAHLETTVQLLGPHHAKDTEKLEAVHLMATKMITF